MFPRDYDSDRQKDYDVKVKKEVIENYGKVCACCDEDRIEFLVIDHIIGGGNRHYKEMKTSIYRLLRRHSFRLVGFRVLCANCNNSYAHYGRCPHQKTKGKSGMFPKVNCDYVKVTKSGAETVTKAIKLKDGEWSTILSVISRKGYEYISHIEADSDGRRYAFCSDYTRIPLVEL